MQEVESRKEEAERGLVSEEEFLEVYKELATRPELYFLMVRSANKDYLNSADLTLFLETEQGVRASPPFLPSLVGYGHPRGKVGLE